MLCYENMKKEKKRKKLKKKFLVLRGFELTTIGLEGQRHTTELKFSLKHCS